MLRIYFTTIFIYTIALWATTMLFAPTIQKRGWIDQESVDKLLNNPMKTFIINFLVALIPVLRLIYFISLIAAILGMENPENEE